MRTRLIASILCVFTGSCARPSWDRQDVARSVRERALGVPAASGSTESALADGLDEDEAVSIALALSPTYQADLARLDSARADLKEAGRLANPQISLLGALGPISAVAMVLAPLDSLWQMPQRTKAASKALEAVAHSLVQNGLVLARDVRVALIDRQLADDRLAARIAIAESFAGLAKIGDIRARVGDSSPAEAASLRADAAVASDAVQVSRSDLTIAMTRLRTTMGVGSSFPRFGVQLKRNPQAVPSTEQLIARARSSRPDILAGELGVRSALSRVRWERSKVLSVAAQVEGHWTRPDELAARIGGRVELPIFNANPGGIGRAEAEVLRSIATLDATRQRVVLEIVTARTRAAQATTSLANYRTWVLPPLEEALRGATRSYELGEEMYVLVLDATRRLRDARLREIELTADWHRAHAELECSVGARLEDLK